MTPEVFFRVCYNMYADQEKPLALIAHHGFKTAILHGYTRRKVRYADYPGITPDKDSSVRGIYVHNLSAENVKNLDWFEGSQYARVKAKVKLVGETGDGEGQELETSTYVFQDANDLEDEEWDFEHFKKEKLAAWA